MNNLLGGFMIGALSLTAVATNAGISNWTNEPAVQSRTSAAVNDSTPSTQEKPTHLDAKPAQSSTTSTASRPQISSPQQSSAFSQEIEKHMSNVNHIINLPEAQALKSDEFLAAVMFNSALTQIGLEIRTKSDNPTTLNLYRSAVGCINAKNSEKLFTAAKKITAEHNRFVDLNRVISSNPQVGSKYTTSCM